MANTAPTGVVPTVPSSAAPIDTTTSEYAAAVATLDASEAEQNAKIKEALPKLGTVEETEGGTQIVATPGDTPPQSKLDKIRAQSKRDRERRQQEQKKKDAESRVLQENADLKRRLDAAYKAQSKIGEDPIEALKSMGIPEKLLQDKLLARVVPEARTKQELEEVRQLIMSERDARVKAEQNLANEREQTRLLGLVEKFKNIIQDEDKYPNISMLDGNLALGAINHLAYEVRKAGGDPTSYTPEDWAEYLEEYQSNYAEARAKKKKTTTTINNDVKLPKKVLTNGLAGRTTQRAQTIDDLSPADKLKYLESLLPD